MLSQFLQEFEKSENSIKEERLRDLKNKHSASISIKRQNMEFSLQKFKKVLVEQEILTQNSNVTK